MEIKSYPLRNSKLRQVETTWHPRTYKKYALKMAKGIYFCKCTTIDHIVFIYQLHTKSNDYILSVGTGFTLSITCTCKDSVF